MGSLPCGPHPRDDSMRGAPAPLFGFSPQGSGRRIKAEKNGPEGAAPRQTRGTAPFAEERGGTAE